MNRVSRISACLALAAATVVACATAPAAQSPSAASIVTPASAVASAVPSVMQSPATMASRAATATASPALPAATEAVDHHAPVAFTGRVVCGDVVRPGVDEAPSDGPVRLTTRGWAWQPMATMSDPRLEGDYYISYDSDDYQNATVTSVGTGTWRIENDHGAWQGSFTNIKYPGSTTIVSTALVGEGAYEGLTALWESTNHRPLECAWAVRGLILEGDVPAAPEPYTGTE